MMKMVIFSILMGTPWMSPSLDRALDHAGLAGGLTASCALPASNEGRWFAIAFDTRGGGQYGVLSAAGQIQILADWVGRPALSCHDPESAAALSLSILQSDTIEGGIHVEPVGAVVCAFVDATESRCWQYSGHSDSFVFIGGWMT